MLLHLFHSDQKILWIYVAGICVGIIIVKQTSRAKGLVGYARAEQGVVYVPNSRRGNARLCNRLPIIHHAFCLALPWTARRVAHIYKEAKLHLSSTPCLKRSTDQTGLAIPYKSIFLGSSMYSLTLTKKVTASRPSSSLWSYVRARYIICDDR
jgi:hypothetical protein